MAQLRGTTSLHIEQPADLVWRQFADLAHHAATEVHKGVEFEVMSDDGTECHYRQRTALGPIRTLQRFELTRVEGEPLVNRIVKGQYTGGSITFTVEAEGEGSMVTAEFVAPISGAERLLAPIMRRSIRRALRNALFEDKADLEAGNYG